MVKFMIPGGNNSRFRIAGRMFAGNTIYDNDIVKVPEKEIIPFIIKEEDKKVETKIDEKIDEKIEEKEELKEEEKIEDKPETTEEVNTNEDLKEKIKVEFTVRELKDKAKEMGLSGYSRMNEEQLIDLLVSEGFKG